MSTRAVSQFLALLTLGGFVAVVVGVVVLVAARSASWARVGQTAMQPLALPLATLAAVGAMSGSLYYSEVAGFDPCRLCWIQRGFMYPAAVVLLAAIACSGSTRRRLAWTAFALAAGGLAVSIYHRLEQQFPDSVGGACALDNPCSGRWVNTFGFITIPTMAAAAFLLVLVFVPMAMRSPAPSPVSDPAKEVHHDLV